MMNMTTNHRTGTFRRGKRRAGTFRIVLAAQLLVLVSGCGDATVTGSAVAPATTAAATAAASAPISPAAATSSIAGSGAGSNAGTGAGAMIWADEFDGKAGAAPDSSRWTASIGGTGWGNSELEYYTDRRANSRLGGDGHLIITALADGGYSCWYGPCRYTSARLTTHKKFSYTYGHFEARIKIPGGDGVWSAFWLLGENIDAVGYPQAGEIDVMENIGSDPNLTIGALHGPGLDQVRANQFGGAVADDFHVFAVDWSPTDISYSVDGRTFWTQRRTDKGWVFDHPFHIVLNVAVGGTAGEPGDTTFPREMLVDYVRVFSTSKT
jgi:beta-glucanase (GH16 family)